MKSPSPQDRRGWVGLLASLLTLAVLCSEPGSSPAQEKAKADKAAGVFDAEEKSDGDKDKEKAKPKGPTVSDRDTINFTQQNVAAQMTELEERMFRLSEALRGLEPENASRLRLALKFSREELILEQMRETQAMLKEAQLSKAETEVRELLAKLEHLRDLLLAEDLDFQLKLARLRQMRETLAQLDRIVKEERRELGWSRFAIEQRKGRERLAGRRPDLQSLLGDQKAVLADTKETAKAEPGAARDETRASIRKREVAVRNAAAALATDPMFADLQPAHLRRAETQLGDAVAHLGGNAIDEAVAAEEKALGSIQDELARLEDRIGQADKAVAEAEFRRHADDQGKNRTATDTLATVSARLGDAGIVLQKDLIRAGASMKEAEGELSQASAEPAAEDQTAALEALNRARDELARSVERLLIELRTELASRLGAELAEMHEIQASIRETTQAMAARAAKKSRTALIALANLSKKEAELVERTERLLGMVEETEFGIALPTALRVLSREMKTVVGWLKDGDASDRTVALEKRIEDDLLGLLQAVRRLPPTTPPTPGNALPADARERERELNRQIAELKMIRLLQVRLNDDTTKFDGERPSADDLPADLRREIEALESTQEEIRDSLAKIAERLENPGDQQ